MRSFIGSVLLVVIIGVGGFAALKYCPTVQAFVAAK